MAGHIGFKMYPLKQYLLYLRAGHVRSLFYASATESRRQFTKPKNCNLHYHDKLRTLLTKCQYATAVNGTKNENVEIYYGILTPQIRAVKIFSLLSSVAGLAAQPILFQHASNLETPLLVALFGFVGFFTFVTPFLLNMVTKKYVTYIHFNSDTGKYSATRLNFFLQEKKISFTAGEVVVPDVPGMFTSFQIKGSPLFVDPRLFEDPAHYAKMMGFDKPIDFKLSKDKQD
ncbi:transmembrane protein 70 homolog, mitochondrial [Periplaneta americana]|uniref:Transmembrane protein 70 homolog, mitochondrial n=1 Tax=Periplaneta americana TaxID=6978 RepID=A0ABQ8TC98_PERAM|nr:hypothetical protein ANN_05645 [Periplaneta americana]